MFHEAYFAQLYLPCFSAARSHIFPVVENTEQFAERQRPCSQSLKSPLMFTL